MKNSKGPSRLARLLIAPLAFGILLGLLRPALAETSAELAPLVEALNVKSYSKKAKAVEALAASGHPRALPVLEALGEGLLLARPDVDLVTPRVGQGLKRRGLRRVVVDPQAGEVEP